MSQPKARLDTLLAFAATDGRKLIEKRITMRPAKPTALKMIQGTYRKDRAKNEPQFSAVRKSVPATISTGAKLYWKELAGLLESARVLTDGDRRVLELACEALAQHHAATVALTAYGLTYTTEGDNGPMIKARPEVGIADAAARRAFRILADFGLTPSSRTRVAVPPSTEPNPFDEFDDPGAKWFGRK